MKVPSNMTEEEVLRVMDKVINKTAGKYTFYGYTVDDIKQESFINIQIKQFNKRHI